MKRIASNNSDKIAAAACCAVAAIMEHDAAIGKKAEVAKRAEHNVMSVALYRVLRKLYDEVSPLTASTLADDLENPGALPFLSSEQCGRLSAVVQNQVTEPKTIRSNVWASAWKCCRRSSVCPSAEQGKAMPTLFGHAGRLTPVFTDRQNGKLLPVAEDRESIMKWLEGQPAAARLGGPRNVLEEVLQVSTAGTRRGFSSSKISIAQIKKRQREAGVEESSGQSAQLAGQLPVPQLPALQASTSQADAIKVDSSGFNEVPFDVGSSNLMTQHLYSTLVQAWQETDGAMPCKQCEHYCLTVLQTVAV